MLEAGGDCRQLRADLIDRSVTGEPSYGTNEVSTPIRIRRLELKRHENVGLALRIRLHMAKGLVEHAHHHGRTRVDVNGAAHDAKVATITALPETVTENHDPRAVRRILLGRKRPPQCKARPECRKEPPRDVDAANPLG